MEGEDAEHCPDESGDGDDDQIACVRVVEWHQVNDGGGASKADDGGEERDGEFAAFEAREAD